jgi:hypothetical protein
MKNIFALIFICSAIQLQAQPDLSAFKDFEVNRCFASYSLDSNNLDTFYIELVPPVFEMYQRPVAKADLYGWDSTNYQLTPTYNKYVKRKLRKGCMGADIPIKQYNAFCVLEIPPIYSPITIKDSLIVFNRIVQHAEMRVINKEKALLSKNKIYPVKGGEWTEWKEFLCTTCGPTRASFMKDIQRALVKNGYDIETDGILGEEERAALLDFQKKNNLPQGRLDIETRRKLGIE